MGGLRSVRVVSSEPQPSMAFGIDIGGSGMKAAPVDLLTGTLTADRHKFLTPQPATPEAMADVVRQLVEHFDWEGNVGVAFPTVVRNGVAQHRGEHRQVVDRHGHRCRVH